MKLLSMAIVLLSGFVALSYEILWFRGFSFASGALPLTFAILLFAYLLGLGLGAALVGNRLPRVVEFAAARGSISWLPVFLLIAAAISFSVLPLLGVFCTYGLWWLGFLPVILAAGMMGSVLPLVSHFSIRADPEAGKNLSHLYVANIIGSTLGSLLTGFLFLDWWTLSFVSGALTVLAILLAAFAATLGSRKRLSTPALVALVLALPLPLLLTTSFHAHFFERCFFKEDWGSEGRKFRTVIENRHGVIAVTEDDLVVGGGTFDGVITTELKDHDRNWIARPYTLGVLHDAPKRVLMVGLSAGPWAQIVAHLPGLEHLHVVEINPGYLELVAAYPAVQSLLKNPKVTISIDDGRRYLRRHPSESYDLIVQNTTQHWRSNSSQLLSLEYFQLIRSRLKPGGIFMVNATGSEAVARTAFQVFPHGLRVYSALVVGDDPIAFSNEKWRTFLSSFQVDGRPVQLPDQESVRRELLDLGLKLGGTERIESREQVLLRIGEGDVVTDDNMACEWRPLRWAP
jgi:spermidine synthase